MDYETFVYEMMSSVTQNLSNLCGPIEGRTVSVSKLQGMSYDGATFKAENQLIGVTVNLKEAYRDMEAGESFESICNRVCKSVMEGMMSAPQINSNDLMKYDFVKSHLTMQIVSTEYNAGKIADIPHKEMQDLSIVYRIDLSTTNHEGEISALVTNEMLRGFHVTPEQLHKDALVNAPKIHPLEIISLRSYLKKSFGYDEMPPEVPGIPELLVASNEKKINGASVIAYPDFFEKASKETGGDFFILPSSIHEVLLIRDNGQLTPQELETMVTEINDNVVDPSEWLTNTVYRYDTKLHTLETGRQFLDRMAEQERPSLLADLRAKAQEVKLPAPGRQALEKGNMML